jgi:protein TonB
MHREQAATAPFRLDLVATGLHDGLVADAGRGGGRVEPPSILAGMETRRLVAATGALAVNALAIGALLASTTGASRPPVGEPRVTARLIEPSPPTRVEPDGPPVVSPVRILSPAAIVPTVPTAAVRVPRSPDRPTQARPHGEPPASRRAPDARAKPATTDAAPAAFAPPGIASASPTAFVPPAAAPPGSAPSLAAAPASPAAADPPQAHTGPGQGPATGSSHGYAPAGEAASAGLGTEASATPDAVRRTGPRVDASWRGNPAPPYPASARRLGEQGEVRLDIHVGADGEVIDVRLRASSGSTTLDHTAIDTVRRWRFRPATVDGQPVPAWYRDWTWVFRLEG